MEGILQNPKILILTLMSLVNGASGFFILMRNWRGSINRTFFVFLMSKLAWGMLYVPYYLTRDLEVARFLQQLTYLSAIFIGFSFFHFVEIFPFRQSKYPPLIKILFGVATGLILVIIFTPDLLVQNVFIQDGYRSVQLNQLGHTAFAAYFLTISIAILYTLISKYRQCVGVSKIQLKFVMLADLATLGWGVWFNLILPAAGIHYYYWLGPYFTILISLSAIYTIRLCGNIK